MRLGAREAVKQIINQSTNQSMAPRKDAENCKKIVLISFAKPLRLRAFARGFYFSRNVHNLGFGATAPDEGKMNA